VHTNSVTLFAERLFYKSEMLRSWLRIEDFPTFGIPYAINHVPTCLRLLLYLSLRMAKI
jgi:hypothetical protein